jgi:hypothetical protein
VVVLTRLRDAGLEGLAVVALDTLGDTGAAVEAMAKAGFERVRLHLSKPHAGDPAAFWLAIGRFQQRFRIIESINPLPLSLSAFKPTTGYDDVKARRHRPPGGTAGATRPGGLAALRSQAGAGGADLRRRRRGRRVGLGRRARRAAARAARRDPPQHRGGGFEPVERGRRRRQTP